MFKIEQADFGIKVTVHGALHISEVDSLKTESVRLAGQQSGSFSILVDARGMVPPDQEGTDLLQECEELILRAGMTRMAFILSSPVLKAHAVQLAHLSGTASVSRFIVESQTEDAEQVAIAWARDGIDPEMTEKSVNDQNRMAHSDR